MIWLIVVILGAIQGLTEFIPVSSSGHLLIADRVFGNSNYDGFEIGALLNIGTLAALVWSCRDRLKRQIDKILKKDFRLLGRVLVATVPVGLAGFFLVDQIKLLHDNPTIMLVMLIGVGLLMIFFDRPLVGKDRRRTIDWKTSLGVGCAQALALIPGTSRSGITILAGRWLGLSRSTAIYWSFALAIPVIAGAIIRVLLSHEGLELINYHFGLVIVGNIVSFAVGLVAIKFLLAILKKKSLRPFGYYRLGLGFILLVMVITNVIN